MMPAMAARLRGQACFGAPALVELEPTSQATEQWWCILAVEFGVNRLHQTSQAVRSHGRKPGVQDPFTEMLFYMFWN